MGRWNWACRFTRLSETQKKSIASQVQASHLQEIRIEIKAQPVRRVKETTHPEKKRPHCVQVISLRTSCSDLARSTPSLFGSRFRRMYGVIEGKRRES